MLVMCLDDQLMFMMHLISHTTPARLQCLAEVEVDQPRLGEAAALQQGGVVEAELLLVEEVAQAEVAQALRCVREAMAEAEVEVEAQQQEGALAPAHGRSTRGRGSYRDASDRRHYDHRNRGDCRVEVPALAHWTSDDSSVAPASKIPKQFGSAKDYIYIYKVVELLCPRLQQNAAHSCNSLCINSKNDTGISLFFCAHCRPCSHTRS
jgi:hypothetical protein